MVNTLQGNRYKDSNNMYRAKKRKEELEEKLVSLDGTMKTPGTNKRLRMTVQRKDTLRVRVHRVAAMMKIKMTKRTSSKIKYKNCCS